MSEFTKPSPQIVRALGKEVDKNKLLLLGLNLLNKGLKLPCAVVRPQAKPTPSAKEAPTPLADKLRSSTPAPPQKLSDLLEAGTRKRKREEDLSEVDKREKRYCAISLRLMK
jgi:hypothetical protein